MKFNQYNRKRRKEGKTSRVIGSINPYPLRSINYMNLKIIRHNGVDAISFSYKIENIGKRF